MNFYEMSLSQTTAKRRLHMLHMFLPLANVPSSCTCSTSACSVSSCIKFMFLPVVGLQKARILYSGLMCNSSPRASFEEVDDEEDDGSNCK